MLERHYLVPSIPRVREREQPDVIKCDVAGAIVGEDARSDSSDHRAKYSSYTLVELKHNFMQRNWCSVTRQAVLLLKAFGLTACTSKAVRQGFYCRFFSDYSPF